MALIIFENLPSTNTPINANNLNNNFNELENGIEELTNANVYSTTETIIGEFLNKPLYRKVIDCGNLPNTTTKDVASGLSNVMIQKIYGRAYNQDNGNALPMPYLVTTASGAISLAYNNNNVRIITDTNRTTWAGIVVLEYTKNSD